jgi:hypothetical protein
MGKEGGGVERERERERVGTAESVRESECVRGRDGRGFPVLPFTRGWMVAGAFFSELFRTANLSMFKNPHIPTLPAVSEHESGWMVAAALVF